MQRRVYRAKLRPERKQEYIDAHRNVSADLMRRYRDAGMALCAVYILGDELVLLIDGENISRTSEILANDPADLQWQSYVGPMKADGDWQEMEELFYADLT